MVSFGMQLGFAVIFSTTIFLYDVVIPGLQKLSIFRQLRFIQRDWRADSYLLPVVKKNYMICLWSQLTFTLALSLAGFIRQFQRTDGYIGVYEGSSILQSIGISAPSLLITAAAYYEEIQRKWLLVLGAVLTWIFSILTEIRPMTTLNIGGLLQSCVEYAEKEHLGWGVDAIRPFNVYGVVLSSVDLGLSIILALIWCWLRQLRWSRGQNRSDLEAGLVELESLQPSTREQSFDTPCPSNSIKNRVCAAWNVVRRDMLKFWQRYLEGVLVVLIIILSSFFCYVAIECFRDLMVVRVSMSKLWEGETGENVWNIGQIIAPFAWLPLLIEILYSAIYP